MKTDLYKHVTDKILAELEAGAAPWVKPWSGQASGQVMPRNAATGRGYSGVNVVLLWMERAEKSYRHPHWLTFKQALDLGGNVRKGERGSKVVFVSHIEKEQENGAGDLVQRRIPFLKQYTVFNIDQCDGLAADIAGDPPAPINPDKRDDLAEEFALSTGADITEGGGGACYVPSLDKLQMPGFETFTGADHYYATLFHELGHWTGHKSRLDRDLKKRFGDQAYAAEELVAELCAAFLCAEFQFDGDLRHAGYIDHWIELLKSDSRAFVTAAARAQKAADFLREIALAAPVAKAA